MKKTINEVLVLQKMVRERVNSLTSLRNQVSTRTSYLYGKDEKKVEEPLYDVKKLDRKVVELQKFLYLTDAAIKQSNAQTQVEVEADTDKLLEPIEE